MVCRVAWGQITRFSRAVANGRLHTRTARTPTPRITVAKSLGFVRACTLHRPTAMLRVSLVVLLVACAGDAPPDDDRETEVDADDAADEADLDDPDAPIEALGKASQITVGGTPVWAHFTNPLAAPTGRDGTILNEAIRLIRATPKAARIHAAIHSLTVNGVAAALIDAKQRGVIVQVVEDGSDEFDGDDSPPKLRAVLGDNHVYCGDRREGGNYGCITTNPSGIMHTKLMTFSATVDPNGTPRQHVVWLGSANMTHATGAKTFNNTLTFYGDKELFDRFNTYFRQLFEQRHFAGNNFYDSGKQRGFFATPTARVFASPDQDTDLVLARLNDIVPDGDCRVRVAQAMIFDSRLEVVDLLGRLRRGGCRVWVAGNHIQPVARARLRDANIPVRRNKLHDKYILVDARFAGSANPRTLVFTGSHNWTGSANSRNDELFVRVESAALHAAYRAHFDSAYDTGN